MHTSALNTGIDTATRTASCGLSHLRGKRPRHRRLRPGPSRPLRSLSCWALSGAAACAECAAPRGAAKGQESQPQEALSTCSPAGRSRSAAAAIRCPCRRSCCAPARLRRSGQCEWSGAGFRARVQGESPALAHAAVGHAPRRPPRWPSGYAARHLVRARARVVWLRSATPG
jgi:hypothetical protein